MRNSQFFIQRFKNQNKFKDDTRVMIFSQYRESVFEITDVLKKHDCIKPMEFVGQSTATGNRKPLTQKEQLNVHLQNYQNQTYLFLLHFRLKILINKVVKKFREGGYNTLVSTCVGEEGLDIGEVDLIICYDSQKNPIR